MVRAHNVLIDKSIFIYITIADYQIALWQKDDMYYAFLPAAFRNIDIEPEIPVEISGDLETMK